MNTSTQIVDIKRKEWEPIYCSCCGAELKCADSGRAGFNTHTGEPYVYAKYKCPNRKHWWDCHDERTFDTVPLRY